MNTADRLSAALAVANAGYRIEREPYRSPRAALTHQSMDHSAWPGADLVVQGIRDLERGAETIESLLVSLSAPQLRALGLTILEPLPDPEVRLYRRLAATHGDGAHAKYNAFVRRIVSFQRAGACAS